MLLIVLYIVWMQLYERRMRKRKIEAHRRALERDRSYQEFKNFFPDE